MITRHPIDSLPGAHDGSPGPAAPRREAEGGAGASPLGFGFTPTDAMVVARTDPEGAWGPLATVPYGDLAVSPASAVFNHAQAAFEGLKAQRAADGSIALFRPEANARRFQRAAERLAMPPLPIDAFVGAVEQLVRANARFVPPHGAGSLYLRPVMMGSGPILGVTPAPSYTFYAFACPVGEYLPGEGRVVVLPRTNRAAPFGTGDVKAAGNYAPTFVPHQAAAARGFKDVLYLDARTETLIEELGSSNFFAFRRDGTLVTPSLGTILPGITRDAVLRLARDAMGWRVEERPLPLAEVLAEADEAFFTGTAAVVQPITRIHHADRDHVLGDGLPGARTAALRRLLVDVQTGRTPDAYGWVHAVPGIADTVHAPVFAP